MGQAFRRAAGKVRTSSIDTPSSSSSAFQSKKSVNQRPPPVASVDRVDIYRNPTDEPGGNSDINTAGNVLDERDPRFDAMLNQMVGRVTSKPGGKMEMGEALFGPKKFQREKRATGHTILSRRELKRWHLSGAPESKTSNIEAFVAERSSRPLPKLRNTKPDTGWYEKRPAPPGTLNVAQLRHILLLHQGKADDHDGAMDIKQIAHRFRIDALQIQKIMQFVSLPPEGLRKQRHERY